MDFPWCGAVKELPAKRANDGYGGNGKRKDEIDDEAASDFAGMLNGPSSEEHGREAAECRAGEVKPQEQDAESTQESQERPCDAEHTEAETSSESEVVCDGNPAETAASPERNVPPTALRESAESSAPAHALANVALNVGQDGGLHKVETGIAEPRFVEPQLVEPEPAEPQPADPQPADPQLVDPRLAGHRLSGSHDAENHTASQTTRETTPHGAADTVRPAPPRTAQDGETPQEAAKDKDGHAASDTASASSSRTGVQPGAASEAPARAPSQLLQDTASPAPSAETRAVTETAMADSLERLEQIRSIVQQLGGRELARGNGHGRSVTMTLYPPTLGKLVFTCQADGSRMSLVVRAESDAAMAVLNDLRTDMVRLVEQEGFRSVQFDIRPDAGSDRRQQAHDNRPARKDGRGQIVPAATTETQAFSEPQPRLTGTSRKISLMA